MIPCAGCSIWPHSASRSAGGPGIRTGTWASASSCPLTGPQARISRRSGQRVGKGFSLPLCTVSSAPPVGFAESRLHRILRSAASRRQRKYHPIPTRCGGHMKLGVPSTPRPPNGPGTTFFKAPIPPGCTLIQVKFRLTMFTWIGITPSCCKCKNTFCSTPFSAQRFTRTSITCQSPYSCGSLLHLHPFSTTCSTAFNTSRLLIFAGFLGFG